MMTLKEYLIDNKQLSEFPILVAPKNNPYHIFSYCVKVTNDLNLCNIGRHPWWNNCDSKYTGEWVSTEDVIVFKQ